MHVYYGHGGGRTGWMRRWKDGRKGKGEYGEYGNMGVMGVMGVWKGGDFFFFGFLGRMVE